MKTEVRRGRKFVEYHDPDTQAEGTFTQEISGADVSYQDETGNWLQTDENWQVDGLDGYLFKNNKLNHKVRLKGDGGRSWYPRRNVESEYLTFGIPQYWNGKRWSNFSFSGYSVEGKTITLETRNDVTILVHSRWNGIKIDWVLASSAAPSRMRYAVALTGITEIEGVLFGADGERLGVLMPTTATDATFDEMGEPTQLPCSGGYADGYVEFQADATGALYPVTIDPDFSVQPDPTDGLDVMIAAVAATQNFGTLTSFYGGVGVQDWYYVRSLIKFDVSSIPSSSTITSANISLYCYTGGTINSRNISTHRALTQWYEGVKAGADPDAGQDGSTWNLRNANGSVVWGTGGGTPGGLSGTDYTATATSTTALTTYSAWYDFDITTDVAAWVDGTASNYGNWLIGDETTAYTYKRFYSSDYTTDTSLRPKLLVTYIAGSAGALLRVNMNAQMQKLSGGM